MYKSGRFSNLVKEMEHGRSPIDLSKDEITYLHEIGRCPDCGGLNQPISPKSYLAPFYCTHCFSWFKFVDYKDSVDRMFEHMFAFEYKSAPKMYTNYTWGIIKFWYAIRNNDQYFFLENWFKTFKDNVVPILENMNGPWSVKPPFFYFKDEHDAILFKLSIEVKET